MSDYSYFNLIKRQAKAHAKSYGVSLSLAQENIARESGFAHFHEMVSVSKLNSSDQRLMLRAVGIVNFDEILFEDPLWGQLDSLVENALNGEIAETNAWGFIVENLEVSSWDYDESTGIATLEVYFEYQGEQDEDRVWHGSGFYVDGQILLIFREGWEFFEDDALRIDGIKTDLDLDHEAELDHLHAQHEASLQSKDGPVEDPFEF